MGRQSVPVRSQAEATRIKDGRGTANRLGVDVSDERLSKDEFEIVQLGEIEAGQRGRVMRGRTADRLGELYARHRITKRQYSAGGLFCEFHEQASFDRIGGQSFAEAVDSSPRPRGAPRANAARARLIEAQAKLGPLRWAILRAVVLEGRNMDEATEMRVVKAAAWMPGNSRLRRTVVSSYLGEALDQLAALWRL